MKQKKFDEIVKKVLKENKDLFETIMQTKETKKTTTKTRLNFTIDSIIAIKFKKFCKEKGYNMSAKIEQAMENLINEKKR